MFGRLVLSALVASTAFLAVPAATASHYGPCTHEWFEVPGYLAEGGDPVHVLRYCVLQYVPPVVVTNPPPVVVSLPQIPPFSVILPPFPSVLLPSLGDAA